MYGGPYIVFEFISRPIKSEYWAFESSVVASLNVLLLYEKSRLHYIKKCGGKENDNENKRGTGFSRKRTRRKILGLLEILRNKKYGNHPINIVYRAKLSNLFDSQRISTWLSDFFFPPFPHPNRLHFSNLSHTELILLLSLWYFFNYYIFPPLLNFKF